MQEKYYCKMSFIKRVIKIGNCKTETRLNPYFGGLINYYNNCSKELKIYFETVPFLSLSLTFNYIFLQLEEKIQRISCVLHIKARQEKLLL